MSRGSTEGRAAGGRAGDDAAVLSRTTLMTVRRVLHAYREGWLLEERLAAAARMAAEDARLRGVPAERMLVALKRAWAALGEVHGLPVLEAQALLGRLVTLSIRAYYRRDRSPGGGGARTAA
jgi:hypothetical protein